MTSCKGTSGVSGGMFSIKALASTWLTMPSWLKSAARL